MANNNYNNQMPQQPQVQRTAGQPAGHPAARPSVHTAAGQSANASGASSAGQPNGGRPGKSASTRSVATNTHPAKQGGSKKRTIIIVLCCVLAAVAVWLLVWLFACNGGGMFDSNARDGQAPYKSDAEIQAELNRQVEEGMFSISIASVIQFDSGTSDGLAYIENVPGNHYNMQVTITDDSTGDVLYESGVLKPNQFIEKITLTRDLEPGTYDATATFTALDGTTYDEIGQAAAKVTINVLG